MDRITDKLRGREVLNTDKAVQASRASLRLNVFDRVGPKLTGPFQSLKTGKVWMIIVGVFLVVVLLGSR